MVITGLVLSSSASIVKRDVGTNLFAPGKEFVYDFSLSSHAGSKDYVSFASTFNITGDLHVQNTGNVLNVKLTDIKFGLYNGEMDYTNLPHINMKAFDQLKPLSEPFSVQLDNGKVRISLNNTMHAFQKYVKSCGY